MLQPYNAFRSVAVNNSVELFLEQEVVTPLFQPQLDVHVISGLAVQAILTEVTTIDGAANPLLDGVYSTTLLSVVLPVGGAGKVVLPTLHSPTQGAFTRRWRLLITNAGASLCMVSIRGSIESPYPESNSLVSLA